MLNLRLFEDADGRRWARGVRDAGLELLCVSQFTLYCQLKGNKPDYRHAMGGEQARQLYQQLVDRLRTDYSEQKVKGEWRSFHSCCVLKTHRSRRIHRTALTDGSKPTDINTCSM